MRFYKNSLFETGLIIGPIVGIIITVGNSSVVIGMWPAHFIWTYYCVMKYVSHLVFFFMNMAADSFS